MCVEDNHFAVIIQFFTIGMAPDQGYTSHHKKELVVCAADFSVIVGHLYKVGSD